MEYEYMSVTSDPKEIGVKKGGWQVEFDKSSFKNKEELHNFILVFPQDSSIEITLLKPLKFKLLKGGIVKDFMNYANWIKGVPFIVSARALGILEQFHLAPASHIRIGIDGREGEDYFLFRCSSTEDKRIVFSESIFYSQEVGQEKQYHHISSMAEYMSFRKRYWHHGIEKIVLENSEAAYDMIQLKLLPGVFVSQKLKKAIELNSLTGVEYGKLKSPVLAFTS